MAIKEADGIFTHWRHDESRNERLEEGQRGLSLGMIKAAGDHFGTPKEENDPAPWRGIATETLPTALKKQLSPHYSQWIVADPERVRYRPPDERFQLFAEDKTGWRAIASLSQLEFAQSHFALVRRQPSSARGSGGAGVRHDPAASSNESSVAVVDTRPQPDVRIKSPTDQAVIQVGTAPSFEGPDTLRVSGDAYDARKIRVSWENRDNGETGNTFLETRNAFGWSPWEARIPQCRPGSYRVRVRAESEYGTGQNEIELRLVEKVIPVAELLFEPGTNTFYLLGAEDAQELQIAARPLDEAISALDQAYQKGSTEQIGRAKGQLDRALAPLVSGAADTSTLTEVIGFRGAKYSYVHSGDLKPHWRSHRIQDMTQNTLLTDGQLDFGKIKEAFSDKKSQFTWDLIEPHSQSLTRWAESFNCRTGTMLLPADNPNRRFDVSPQAQLMRYTHGASLNGDIDFSQKSFGLSAKTQVTLALAEARADFNAYIPKAEGHPLRFNFSVEKGPRQGQIKEFNCGHIRAKLQAELSGFAGASLQAGVNVHFHIGASGKVEVRGATKDDRDEKSDPSLSGEAFAGLKGGCEVSGAAEWQNPEKNKNWGTLAKVGYGGEVAFGGGGKADFAITYDKGKFVIRAKAYLIWGAGGGGGFIFTVHADNISEFCMFVYHQLKDNDFGFLDFMSSEAFEYFDTLQSYVLLADDALETAYQKGAAFLRRMQSEIQKALQKLQSSPLSREEVKWFIEKIRRDPELVLFLPPEGKGRLLCALCRSPWSSFTTEQKESIIAVLSTIQTQNEYREVTEHLTIDGRRIAQGENAWMKGEGAIWSFLNGVTTGRFQYEKVRLLLSRMSELPREPLTQTAALRNNEILIA